MLSFTINLDYLKSWNSIFKILHLVLGTICVGIIGHEFNGPAALSYTPLCFFLIIACTFYIGTFILFLSYMLSPSASSIIPKTIYEFLYHTIASVLLLASTIALMVHIHQKTVVIFDYSLLLAASICSLVNTVLYICSAVMGFGTYGDGD